MLTHILPARPFDLLRFYRASNHRDERAAFQLGSAVGNSGSKMLLGVIMKEWIFTPGTKVCQRWLGTLGIARGKESIFANQKVVKPRLYWVRAGSDRAAKVSERQKKQ